MTYLAQLNSIGVDELTSDEGRGLMLRINRL